LFFIKYTCQLYYYREPVAQVDYQKKTDGQIITNKLEANERGVRNLNTSIATKWKNPEKPAKMLDMNNNSQS